MNKQATQIITHIIFCIAFLSLPVLFSPDFSSDLSFISIPPFQRDFITYTLLLIIFYFNTYYLIPNYYFKKKYLPYIGFVILCYLIVSFVPMLIIQDFPFQQEIAQAGTESTQHMPPHLKRPFFWRLTHHFYQFLMVFIFSLLIEINSRWKTTEKEKLNAELSYLKAQINPHFLFNTLNSIYALSIEKSDYTSTAVVKLSNMMRYVIYDSRSNYVSIEKELNYISDYIELQKIRLGNTVSLSYQLIGEIPKKNIAPLILIAFVENAFKYGVNAEENSVIDISIEMSEEELIFKIKNNKVSTKKIKASESGVGIENTKNRLQLLYPQKHMLFIKNEEKEFSIYLTLILQ